MSFAQGQENCFAILLNRTVYQPGETILARFLPLSCSPGSIDLNFSIQYYNPQTLIQSTSSSSPNNWKEVAHRIVHLRGLTSLPVPRAVIAFTIQIPEGESEFAFGFYRIVIQPVSVDPVYRHYYSQISYKEIPVFFIGSDGREGMGKFSTPPEERNGLTVVLSGKINNSILTFVSPALAGLEKDTIFYQILEDESMVSFLTKVKADSNGKVTVMLPNTFRRNLPVWGYFRDYSGVSNTQLIALPVSLNPNE